LQRVFVGKPLKRIRKLYFPDLSPYTYATKLSFADVLNVGWLDQSMPFSKGATANMFLHKLKSWFRVARVNPMRGIHECNFCRTEQWPLLPLHENPSINVGGRDFFQGNWEMWIPGTAQTIFASPGLIIHYVEVHEYCPPEEFISAVMDDGRMSSWNAEIEFEQKMNTKRQI
jgi:hypothetical protein